MNFKLKHGKSSVEISTESLKETFLIVAIALVISLLWVSFFGIPPWIGAIPPLLP